MKQRMYLCIDLKSFYASVECAERNLDPMTSDLVVADPTRNQGTICLAVSPALKSKGVKNRCRIYEIPEKISYLMAPPRMQLYIDYSAEIYSIYLKYIAKEDIHVYSIDEAFLDVTDYLHMYNMDARDLAITIMNDIHHTLGITATCGIGTNLYLTKIALDITAKHVPDHIGFLDEATYQKTLWAHKPLTDFWRIGPGTARRLAKYGIFTMGQIAHAPKELMYKNFGVDAEILIDHAWGREPVTMKEIKSYHVFTHSLSSGQVLFKDYTFDEGKLIVKEMADLLCLDLVAKGLITDSLTLYIGYTKDTRPSTRGSEKLNIITNSNRIITKAFVDIFDRTTDPDGLIRRVSICCNNVIDEVYEQYDLFTDPEELAKDRNLQYAVLKIKEKYGKNSLLRGMNFLEGATTRDRNMQIGGHKSG